MALGKRAWGLRKRAWRSAIVKVARGNTIDDKDLEKFYVHMQFNS